MGTFLHYGKLHLALGATLQLLGFAYVLPSAGQAACVAPTKQTELEKLLVCTNALCCPRDLDLQINLVKALAARLRAKGYAIAEPGSPAEQSPEFTGTYKPFADSMLRRSIRQYKADKAMADPGDEITYQLVSTLLGANLFDRWKVR